MIVNDVLVIFVVKMILRVFRGVGSKIFICFFGGSVANKSIMLSFSMFEGSLDVFFCNIFFNDLIFF